MGRQLPADDLLCYNSMPLTAPVQNRLCEDGDVRLVGGSKEGEGLVEVCINNRWGTVCGGRNSQWDNDEAAVVCHQLGYDLAETSKSINRRDDVYVNNAAMRESLVQLCGFWLLI